MQVLKIRLETEFFTVEIRQNLINGLSIKFKGEKGPMVELVRFERLLPSNYSLHKLVSDLIQPHIFEDDAYLLITNFKLEFAGQLLTNQLLRRA